MDFCTGPISSNSHHRKFSSFPSAQIVLSLKEPDRGNILVNVRFTAYYLLDSKLLLATGPEKFRPNEKSQKPTSGLDDRRPILGMLFEVLAKNCPLASSIKQKLMTSSRKVNENGLYILRR